MIDQALNQARLLLFNQDRPDWSIPVLFTRLKHGQLFTTFQKIERLKKDFSDKENKEALSLSLDAAPSGIIPGKVPYNTAEIRKLLREGLSDQDLNDLCMDNFRIVYDQFSSGMTKQQKIHSLIEHCSRRNKFPQLLDLVKGLSPEKYAEYEHSLTSAGQ